MQNKTPFKEINIIQLIEKNSITRLSSDYENKLINKIKETFTDTEQQIFLSSFYCFINYDSKKDFVIDFDNVWKWCGFSRKDPAKRLLEKNFTIDIDYIIKKAAPPIGGAAFETVNKESIFNILVENKNIGGAGQNKEKIMLTVNTFKKFCLKANTKKADEIHDYYIKLEELLQETINEETNELRLQLSNHEEEKLKIEEENNSDIESEENENNEVVTKKCSQCNLNKIKDKFGKNPTRSDGLNNICKDCNKDNYQNLKEKKKITLEEKKCTKCDILKNISEFYNRVGSPDGKTSECNKCTKIMYKNRFEIRKQSSNIIEISEKKCKKCNQILIISAYSKKTDSSDGYNCNCKLCVSKNTKEKSQATKETPESKCCNTCNKVLSIEKFWNCISNPDGKNNRCSDCCKVQRKKN